MICFQSLFLWSLIMKNAVIFIRNSICVSTRLTFCFISTIAAYLSIFFLQPFSAMAPHKAMSAWRDIAAYEANGQPFYITSTIPVRNAIGEQAIYSVAIFMELRDMDLMKLPI